MLYHLKKMNGESLGDFYTNFNKELVGIDQVITYGKTIHAFLRAFSLKGLCSI